MWMDTIIIILCIQASVFTQHVESTPRINKEEQEEIYGSQVETPLEDQEFEQKDFSKADYGSDEADTFIPEANIIQNEDPEDYRQDNSQRSERGCRRHLRPPKDRLHVVKIRGVNPPNKVLVDSDFADPDVEADDEPEDPEGNAETDDQNEMDLNENIEQVEEGKNGLKMIDRTKRLINKEILSSSSDPLENNYDNSLNDNETDDYGEKEPLSDEEIPTVRRVNAERSTVINTPIQSLTASLMLYSKGTTVLNSRYNHDIKAKFMKNNTSLSSKKLNSDSSRQDDFAELSKAYQELVCAVERFMSLANRTSKKLDKSDECVGITTTSVISEPFTTTWSPRTTCATHSTAYAPQTSTYSSQTTTSAEDNNGNFLFSEVECTTSILAEKGESTVICDKADTDPEYVHRKLNNGGLNDNNKKKQPKSFNNEYIPSEDVPDQGGIYVYNDYDSVDPNQEFTEIVGKPSLLPTTYVKYPILGVSTIAASIKESSDSFLRKSSWKNSTKTNEPIMERQRVDVMGRPDVQPEGIRAGTLKPFTAIFGTKLKTRHSRKQKSKGIKKISSFVGKMRSRKRPTHNRFPDNQLVKEDSIILPHLNKNYPTSKNAQHEKKGETEIIELEYV